MTSVLYPEANLRRQRPLGNILRMSGDAGANLGGYQKPIAVSCAQHSRCQDIRQHAEAYDCKVAIMNHGT